SSPKIGQAGAAILGLRQLCVLPPTDTRCCWSISSTSFNASLYERLNYNFIRDIEPVASISRETNVMVVNPSVPSKTLPESTAYAKANPGKINFASGGNGTPSHVAGELFKMMIGVNIHHVPYRGAAPALTDLLSGQVQIILAAPLSGAIGYVRAGQIRALAVTNRTRSEMLPEVPTVGEFVPGFEPSGFFAVGAPRNTPAEIVTNLNTEINAGLDHAKIKARLADVGNTVLPGSPADFGTLIATETEKWGKVIRAANIKAE